jgi:hypothetical protein
MEEQRMWPDVAPHFALRFPVSGIGVSFDLTSPSKVEAKKKRPFFEFFVLEFFRFRSDVQCNTYRYNTGEISNCGC